MLAAAFVTLGMLAALAVLASEMPPALAVPLAIAAWVHGAWLCLRELRRPTRRVVIPPGSAAATVDEVEVQALVVQWRGPLVTLRWRDAAGRAHGLHATPDTLRAPVRRELRLAMLARVPARSPRSVAP